jgi:hypothetical protein
MADDDFEKADEMAGVQVMPPAHSALSNRARGDVMEYRTQLVERYHRGAPSLVERLRKAGKEDHESLLLALIDEVVTETDHLLGNELLATENGELRDSSVISYKRAEVLEKAIKAVQAKQEFEKASGIDVDAPSMMVIFRFFMSKAKEAFDKMSVGSETSDLFFRTLGDSTDNWKKELREYFEAQRGQRQG